MLPVLALCKGMLLFLCKGMLLVLCLFKGILPILVLCKGMLEALVLSQDMFPNLCLCKGMLPFYFWYEEIPKVLFLCKDMLPFLVLLKYHTLLVLVLSQSLFPLLYIDIHRQHCNICWFNHIYCCFLHITDTCLWILNVRGMQ